MWPVIERTVRYARAAYIDLRLFVTGKRERDIPPLRLRFVGSGDFRSVGQHLLNLTVSRGALTLASRVLDIGCGSGRLALPLAKFLTAGTYDGFDVVAPAIRWCRRHITRSHPNFRFRHVSLRNSDYAAAGRNAARFVFPYEDASFDCVVAYSVFTHLQYEEIRNYVRESCRVLAPDGRFVATFFLLSGESEAGMRDVPGVLQFPHAREPVRLASDENPALAVAIAQPALERLLREAGFREISIEPGGWYGRQGAPEFQDLVTCRK